MKKLWTTLAIAFVFLLIAVPITRAKHREGQEHSPANTNAGFFVANVYTQAPAPTLSTPELIEADVANGEISEEIGYLYLSYAFFDYENLPEKYHSNAPWNGTSYLVQLQEAIATMPASNNISSINSMLAGACSDSGEALPNTVNTTHFHVQYNTIGGGLDINDYSQSLETTWATEVDTFGWAAPPVLVSNPPPGNRYHVRIDELGGGLYGYVSPVGDHAGVVGNNPNTAWDDGDATATCMVLNEDFSGFPGSAQNALDATTSHEFNHSLQYGYGAGNETNDIYWEGGASWMEDEVFDGTNDNYNYLWPEFDMCMANYTESPYSFWITFRGLTERFGTGIADGSEQVMQDFWEETSKNTNQNLNALNTALQNKGSNLADAYHDYAVAVKFNKSCDGGYVYPHCFDEGADYVGAVGATAVHGAINSIGNTFNGLVPDDYALNWVSLPTGATPYEVSLQNNSGGQLRGSVVCDDGNSLRVTPLSTVAGSGQTAVINTYNPVGCNSVIAVITNQAQSATEPSCTARSYTLSVNAASEPPAEVFLPLILNNYPTKTGFTNGDFEAGVWGWSQYSLVGNPSIITNDPTLPVPPRSGEYLAGFGGANNEVATIEQEIMVSSEKTLLTYFYWIMSNDTTSACGDFANVYVNQTDSVLSYDLCGDTNTERWRKQLIDLSDYIGQSITISFVVITDEAMASALFIDDVEMQGTGFANGDFEYANKDWNEYSQNGHSLILHQNELPDSVQILPHSGYYMGVLRAFDGVVESAFLNSIINISKNETTLAYNYWIESNETNCQPDPVTGNPYDNITLLIQSGASTELVPVDSFNLCTATETAGWEKRTVDLSEYAEKPVALVLAISTNDTEESTLLVDDFVME